MFLRQTYNEDKWEYILLLVNYLNILYNKYSILHFKTVCFTAKENSLETITLVAKIIWILLLQKETVICRKISSSLDWFAEMWLYLCKAREQFLLSQESLFSGILLQKKDLSLAAWELNTGRKKEFLLASKGWFFKPLRV